MVPPVNVVALVPTMILSPFVKCSTQMNSELLSRASHSSLSSQVKERRMSLTSDGSPSCSKPDTKCVVLELSVKLNDNGLGKT